MYDRSVSDLELRPGYLRVHVPSSLNKGAVICLPVGKQTSLVEISLEREGMGRKSGHSITGEC
jgi:hypothetical protein